MPVKRIPKVIGIVGSRSRDTDEDFRLCLKAFEGIYRLGDRLVSGGCGKGADHFAEVIARSRGLTITIHFPDWSYGNAAGLVRNTHIAKDCDVLIALVTKDRKGGTEDTVRKVLKMGKKVVVA